MSRVRAATRRYRSTGARHDDARAELHDAIRVALAAGAEIGKVAAESPFDREHVRRIRDNRLGHGRRRNDQRSSDQHGNDRRS